MKKPLFIVLIVFAGLCYQFQNCSKDSPKTSNNVAKNDVQTSQPAAAVKTPCVLGADAPHSTRYWSPNQLPKCALECWSRYAFRDDTDITNEWGRLGRLHGGGYEAAINDAHALRDKFYQCLQNQ